MATSGTVGTTTFNTRKLIDRAYGRAGILPQQITDQRIEVAMDNLFLFLSMLSNRGVPLWALQKDLLPLYEGQISVPTLTGTVSIRNCNIRNATRLSGTASASEGTAANAFDADFTTACTQASAAGYIQLLLETATRAPIFGVLPNAAGSWTVSFQGSADGVTFTTLSTQSFTAVSGEWHWFEVEQVASWLYYRLQAAAGTTLDIQEFYVGSEPRDIPLAQVNHDVYATLPNKHSQGRPTQYWFDKQRGQPIIALWPAPSSSYAYYHLETYVQRQIQDVGSMVQEVEVPQGWYSAVRSKLAFDLCLEDKEANQKKLSILKQESVDDLRDAWANESDGSVASFTPNIAPYTR